ncbi:MAG TPA: outer membrane beta-barrel protein [Steroidobacteraceae bacterium]|nr:outer membrane beta-barrel protein [Steroidobacteraceae bacterium]
MKARMLAVASVTTRLALLLATVTFVAPAFAQGTPESWRGVYAGAGGSYSNVSVEIPGSGCRDCYYWWGDYPAYDEGDGDYSYVGNVGYRAGRYFAVEAAYVDAGTIGWDKPFVWMPELDGYYRNQVDFSAEIPEISAVGIFPFLRRWEVYGRLGAGFWSGESQQTLTNVDTGEVIHRRASDDGVGALVGLGLGFSFAESLHTRFEYQAVWIDGDALNVNSETTLDSITWELQYRFGARRATAPAATDGAMQVER